MLQPYRRWGCSLVLVCWFSFGVGVWVGFWIIVAGVGFAVGLCLGSLLSAAFGYWFWGLLMCYCCGRCLGLCLVCYWLC